MKYVHVFLLVGFIAISVFGIFSMSDVGHDHADTCIAATAQGADCPKESNPLSYLAFHLDGFKSLSSITVGENTLVLLITLVFFIAGVGAALERSNLVAPPLDRAYALRKNWQLFNVSSKRAITRWLALHENSPAFS
jgi:hypothetical protein